MLNPTVRSWSRSMATAVMVLMSVATWYSDSSAQQAPDIPKLFDKIVYRIPMRDGAKLYTVVYVPKDHSQSYPILLNRTPYTVAPYNDEYKTSLGPSDLYVGEGYIFAYQDVRGRFMSEGEFVDMRPQLGPGAGPKDIDESTDTWDTIDFLVKNVPVNNGRVGMYGISYPGFYTAAGVINAHPALKCASPQAPISDWFLVDDFHHNGAFFLTDAFRFFSVFGLPRPNLTTEWGPNFDFKTADAYKFYLELGALKNANERYFHNNIKFWNDLMAHDVYDEYWKARSLPPHLTKIQPAILTVGGWFDAEDLSGALKTYQTIEHSSPGIQNTIVMGPWFHGGWARSAGDRLGDISFDSKTSEYYQREIELPFFNHYLKDKPMPKIPEAAMFETGSNQWRSFESWPPAGAVQKSLYLGPDHSVSFDEPKASDAGFDEYVSDPARPVPFTGETALRRSREYMDEDQRFAWRRPDVVSYQTPILEKDVTLAGSVEADLWVSTTGTDADFVVKIIDVLPDGSPDPDAPQPAVELMGYQMLVRAEVMRGKFRNSFTSPEPFVPGQVTNVKFKVPDLLHTFKKGHRMMVQIQSSWFPLVDRNPQKFCNIYTASDSDFQKATHRIYRTYGHFSRIRVAVLEP